VERALRDVIEEMAAEVDEGPAVYRPSKFWVRLNDLHEAQLTDAGFEGFKRTVNQSASEIPRFVRWRAGLFAIPGRAL
jgi:hypothetical protein